MRRKNYELIIFDWDGTLMDSERKIINCFQSAASDLDIAPPEDADVRNIIGLGMAEAVAAVFPECPAEQQRALIDQYRHHFLEADQTDMPLFPEVYQLLHALAESGTMLAIATGKARRGLTRVLEHTGLAHLFVASRCADEAFSKPHPKMLLDILDETGLTPGQAIMVGDTVYDLQMAQNAKMDSLAVSYGAHDRERLIACDPLHCFDDFRGVVEWLS